MTISIAPLVASEGYARAHQVRACAIWLHKPNQLPQREESFIGRMFRRNGSSIPICAPRVHGKRLLLLFLL